MVFEDTAIKDVIDYLEWVKCTSLSENSGISFEQTKVYYRGQSDSSWNITPGIFREIKQGTGKKLDESRLLKQASLCLWNEMNSFKTYLEKLIYLQHYGLKTRLLDVTFNPLTALYFACIESKENEKNEGKDGVVFCGYKKEHYDPITAEFIAEYLFTRGQSGANFSDLEFFAKQQKAKVESFAETQFIFAPINNLRIEAQDGAFIMPSLIKGNGYIANYDKLDNSGFFDKKRAIISKNYKDSILQELFLLGINSGTIYKGVSDKLEAIQQEESWRILKYEINETSCVKG